jgi:serine/threonine protein kinase
MMTACGSTLYIAPEVLTAKSTGMGYGKECDLWAVGVMAYILICCRPPFSGATSWHVGQAIQKGAYTYPEYALVTDGGKQLIAGLLQVNAGKRLTAKEALNMPWIASVAAAKEQRQMEVRSSTQVPASTLAASTLLTPSAHRSPSPIPLTKAGETASGEEEEGGETETETETASASLPSWLRNIVNALAGGMRDIEEHHTHHTPLDHHTHHTALAPMPA